MFPSVHTYLLFEFWISVAMIVIKIGTAAYEEKISFGMLLSTLLASYFICWEMQLLGWFN